MQSRIDRMTASTERGIQRLSRSTDHLSSRLTDAGTSGAVGLAGPVAVAGTALTLINKATTETDLLARSVQVSTGTIDGLTHALRGAGFETEDVISLVEEMNNKLGESAGLQEITPVTESLGILGLSFERIKDLSPEEQFLAITDAALKMEDAQKAAADDDLKRDKMAQDLMVDAAKVYGQYGTAVDVARIKAEQDKVRMIGGMAQGTPQ